MPSHRRKRPLSSMSPTIVLENGQPVLTVGAAGGPTIITQVLQALVRRLDLGLPLDQALAQPRIHQQWSPDAVRIESQLDESLQKGVHQPRAQIDAGGEHGVTQAISSTEPPASSGRPRSAGSGQSGGAVKSKRLQILDEVLQLVIAQLAAARDVFRPMRAGEHGLERMGEAIVQ